MATPNAPLETTLTASTQLFATPRRAPQFRIAQVRVKARPRAKRYRRGRVFEQLVLHRNEKDEMFDLSERVWKSVRDNTGPAQGDGSSRTGCMTKDGYVCLSCGSASTAASGRPGVWEVIGDRIAHGEGRVTQHGSVVVRLSVWDEIAVGGGRMYTAAVPRYS